MQNINEHIFWEEKYKKEKIPWDIGEVAPAFVKYFCDENRELLTENKEIAVLGCGHGHDAFYLAKNIKCQVYAFDFSESAISYCNQVKEKQNIKNINFYQIDIFELIKDKKWASYFDLIIEHTCFCAIDPKRRDEYIKLVKYLLKPNGELVGLFFIRDESLGGPPYGSTPELIKNYFKNYFQEVVELRPEPCLHSNLQGEEYFGVFKRWGRI